MKEYENLDIEKIVLRNNVLESDNRLLSNRIKKLRKEIKELEKMLEAEKKRANDLQIMKDCYQLSMGVSVVD